MHREIIVVCCLQNTRRTEPRPLLLENHPVLVGFTAINFLVFTVRQLIIVPNTVHATTP